jgi:uncharacterized glyoxalase superfamily protein PhnB
MSDPLDALRLPDVPVDPRPAFAADLRARLLDALDHGGTPMTTTDPAPTTALPGTPPGQPSFSPYLAVHDARAAIRYYTEVFDAVPDGSVFVADDGRIGHAALRIRDAVVMLADPWEVARVDNPAALGATTVQLHLYVEDCDETFRRAVAAGGEALRPPANEPYGDRSATVADPFGHVWMINTAGRGLTQEELNRNLDGGGFHLEDAGDLDEVDLGGRD